MNNIVMLNLFCLHNDKKEGTAWAIPSLCILRMFLT